MDNNLNKNEESYITKEELGILMDSFTLGIAHTIAQVTAKQLTIENYLHKKGIATVTEFNDAFLDLWSNEWKSLVEGTHDLLSKEFEKYVEHYLKKYDNV